MANGSCDLTDGSVAGDWHLPTLAELDSLVDATQFSPALPTGHPFINVKTSGYWSPSIDNNGINLENGIEFKDTNAAHTYYVWPVRGGQAVGSKLVADKTLDFGKSAKSGSAKTLTISNTGGTARLQVSAMALAGSDFNLNPGDGSSGSCGSTTPIIAPDGSCTVTVTFTPATVGAKTATLHISSGDVTAPLYDITLSGTGAYTVTFATTPPSSVLVAENAKVDKPTPDPTMSGSTFGGWYADSSVTAVFDFNTPITADITLYPKWTVNSYTVSFVSNGGSTVVDQTVNHGNKATSPAPAPTKAGSTLVGWYSDVALTVVFDFNTAITANITLYAKWSLNSYTVSFNSTGGSAVDPQSVVYNNNATRPVNPARAGYSFINWYTDLNLTTVFDFTTKITADTALYAKWAYTLSYDGNGGTGAVPAPSTHTQPDTVALPSTPGDLVRTGFTFIGWNTDRSANTKLDTVVVSGPTTVYAIWMTTLSYDGNGNSGGSTPAGASYPSSALVTVSGNTGVLTKADYLFSGWDKVVGDTVTPVYEGQTFSITGNTVLRARWVKSTAAARFINNNNGTVTDTLTGFVWMKDAGCVGRKTLADAKTAVGALASGACATTDGSVAGDWRLPTMAELKSLVDSAATVSPPLPTGHPFTGVQISGYWSSLPANSGVNMEYGAEFTDNIATHAYYVWPVRGGQVVGTDITTDATEVAYSSVIVNTGSTRLLTITNSGTTRLQVDGMAISGSAAAQFVLNTATGNCGVTPILAPNGSCTVSITFTPATLGAKTATLRIVSGAVRTPVVDINLTGTGVATPVDGVCGTSNGAAFEFKPTTGLCTAGTASDPSGSGPWNWTCSGSAGGATASCSATACPIPRSRSAWI